MNNTTKGEWKVYHFDSKKIRPLYAIRAGDGGSIEIGKSGWEGKELEAEATAHLIALAGNLNQKYDLSKLERFIQDAIALRGAEWMVSHDWGGDRNGTIEAFDAALTSITRESKPQP